MAVLDLFSLKGQAAVVTGGSRGIGRGIALCLAEAGADVVVSARRAEDLEEVVAEVEKRGRSAKAIVADMSRPEDVERLAAEASAWRNHLSIWVNNVGGQPDMRQRPFVDVDLANFEAQVDLNLKSVWAGVRAAARVLREGGTVINISSRAALHGHHTGHALYAASKAAVNNLTGALAAELGPKLRVNAVCPGPILTETFYETMQLSPEQAEALLPSIGIPAQRYGQPVDVAAAVVFLASPAASWITGECLYVTGGS